MFDESDIDWEVKKGGFQKERLTLETTQIKSWKERLAAAEREHKTKLSTLARNLWLDSKKLSSRTYLLGKDILGNRYWFFSCRKRAQRDWGAWVYVESADGLA